MYLLGLLLGVLAVLPCVLAYFLFIRAADRYEPEPLWLLLLMLAWGAFGASLTAIVGDALGAGALQLALDLGADDPMLQASTATFVAPLVEESTKGIALVVLLLAAAIGYRELDGPLDGAIYGGVIGLGFTLAEDSLYLGQAMAEGGAGAFGATFFFRTLLAGLGHASFTAVTGLGVGLAAASREPLLKLVLPLAGWMGAVGLHFVHNLLCTFLLAEGVGVVVKLLLFWLFDLLFFLLVVALVLRDRYLVRNGLADEVGVLLDRRELDRVTSLWMLLPLWNWLDLLGSRAGYLASRRKQLDLVELGFLEQRRARGEPGLDAAGWELRERIERATRAGVTLV
jgi:protease PrsW